MRRSRRESLSSPGPLRWLAVAFLGFAVASCGKKVEPEPKVQTTPVQDRVARRSFDGAPPVIPHTRLGPYCGECHTAEGKTVPGVGFAPPTPHGPELSKGSARRCEACHLFQDPKAQLFAASDFEPRRWVPTGKATVGIEPPVIPHPLLMRENCAACHSGPAAHATLCTHPERVRCTQCHVQGDESGLVFTR